MSKFELNLRGQMFEVEANNEEELPQIAQQILDEQEFQQTESVEDVPGAIPREFRGEITNPDTLGTKIKKALPAVGQFVGGMAGGGLGALVGRPAIGSAAGGVIGRAAGRFEQSMIRQIERDPVGTIDRQIKMGPLAATISGMSDSEKKFFGKEVLKTGVVEALFAPLGAAASAVSTNVTKSIGSALLGDRVMERGAEVGFKRLLDPKFYKGRLAKDVAIKANNFFKKLTKVTGEKTAEAINRSGVGDVTAPVEQISKGVQDLDAVFRKIDDFGPEVSSAQKTILKELREEFLNLDEGTTIAKLWEKRKNFDKTRFGRTFKQEAVDYLDGLRKIISAPIRESSDEVAESFGRYSFVKEQQKDLGNKLSASVLGDPETTGEIFAPKTEQFLSTLSGTTKDETVRLLKQLDDFLGVDDKLVEGLIDASAAEAIEKGNIGVDLAGRIAARLFGGRKGIAGIGAAGQSVPSRIIKRSAGRAIPTAVTELSLEDEQE